MDLYIAGTSQTNFNATPSSQHEVAEVARIEPNATPAELQELQSKGQSPVAIMYRAIMTEEPLTDEQLCLGSKELRQLNQHRHALQIGEHGLLEIRVCIQGKARWCVICPAALRMSIIWQAHNILPTLGWAGHSVGYN